MSKIEIKLLDGSTAINTAIDSIKTRGKSLEKDIHVAAVSCLVHADKHGDITLAEKLVQAVPSLARKNALRDWFIAHGKFNYDAKSKSFTYDKTSETLVEEATVTPFWEFKPEVEYKPFDLDAAVQTVLKRAVKAMERGDELPQDKLEALRKIAV